MLGDVFSSVRSYLDCTQLRETHFKHRRLMKLFPAAGPPGLVAMDLLGPWKKTLRGNTFTLIIIARFTSMTRCKALRNTTAPTVTAAYLEYRVGTNGTPP